MKKFFVCALFTMIAGAAAFAADPAEGYWASYDDKSGDLTAVWNFYINAGGEMEAVIVYSPQCDETAEAAACKNLNPGKNFPRQGDLSKMKIIKETPWIFALKKTASGVWEKGNIIDCGEGKMYSCKVTFTPADGGKFKVDTLIMRGSIGPLGRNQFWRRPDAEILKNVSN